MVTNGYQLVSSQLVDDNLDFEVWSIFGMFLLISLTKIDQVFCLWATKVKIFTLWYFCYWLHSFISLTLEKFELRSIKTFSYVLLLRDFQDKKKSTSDRKQFSVSVLECIGMYSSHNLMKCAMIHDFKTSKGKNIMQ